MPTVMIAVDGPEESGHIMQTAVRCFGSDATYLAIHVEDWRLTIGWPWGAAAVAPAHGAAVGGYPATVVTADDAAAEARQIAQAAGVEATPIGALGDPVTAIARAADDYDVDVVVAGWRHRNRLQRLFTRATTEALLESSTIPIMFVPASSRAVLGAAEADIHGAAGDLSSAA